MVSQTCLLPVNTNDPQRTQSLCPRDSHFVHWFCFGSSQIACHQSITVTNYNSWANRGKLCTTEWPTFSNVTSNKHPTKVCYAQGKSTTSGLPLRTSYVCGDFHHSQDFMLNTRANTVSKFTTRNWTLVHPITRIDIVCLFADLNVWFIYSCTDVDMFLLKFRFPFVVSLILQAEGTDTLI